MVVARRAGVAVVAAAILAIAACSNDAPAAPPRPMPKPMSTFSSYVAMGDSFVAGPGINPVDPVSGGCQRSLNNWPTLLAKELHIPSLQDVSCSGATSVDIYQARPPATAAQPGAQIDVLSPSTDLVTLSIGGNDEGVFGRIIFSCAAGNRVSDACSPFFDTKLDGILQRTTNRVALSIERIRAKAPNARIVLVGYLRVLPEQGGCVVPGLAAARFGPAVAGQNALDATLKAAAQRANVDYVSMSARSLGHESCDGDTAWVNGMQPLPGDGAYLHPNAAGMRAVADILAKHLS